jgi:hypothetical protein
MPFLKDFHKQLLENQKSKLILFGPQQVEIVKEELPEQIEMYRSVESFIFKYFSEGVFV